jgi:TonB-linked SusC/RagA family outer membrane protein
MRKLLLFVCILLGTCFHELYAQQISGTVVDEAGSGLPGVTITNTSNNRSTQSAPSGAFSLPGEVGNTLSFTFVGYQQQNVRASATSGIRVTMRVQARDLQEVTVAYGQKRRQRELGYQAPVVSGTEIAATQRENFFNSLAGRIPGATVTSSSGAPGSSSSIILRGATSIGGNNQPLLVVDGVPYDNQTFNQENLVGGGSVSFANRQSDYSNRAMDINPNDIESLTVLKGPEATALYGSDGASGALIITTRKGKSGIGTISYDNSFRFENVYRFPEVQRTYARGLNGVYNPTATVNPFALGDLYAFLGPKYPDTTVFYDNFDSFFKTGFTQKHNVSLEGGSEGATYRFSTNYTNQDGIIPSTGFNSISFRLTGTARLKKNLTASSSFTYVNSVTDKASKGMGSYLLTLLNWPVDDDASRFTNVDGTRRMIRGTTTNTTEYDNPFWDVEKNPSEDRVSRATGNLQLNYDPLSWLNLSGVLGVDAYSQEGLYAVHPESRYGFASGGFTSSYDQITRNISGNIRGTAKKEFGKFTTGLTAGFSFDDNNTKIDAFKGERFYEKNVYSINNTDPLSRNSKLTKSQIRKVRFISNANLSYNDLVYLSLSATREGNSTLNSSILEKDPYYNFYGSSLSFVFTDLKAFENIPWLSFGKARISYATTGKGPISPYIIDYTFESQLTTGGGYAYGITGNNMDLQPEYTNTFEYGAELKFFNDRLGIDIARYSQRTKDQILAARAAYPTGSVIKWLNGGLVENRGIEIQLTGTPVRTINTRWNVTVNYDRNVGQVLEMPANLPTYYDSDTWVFGNIRSQLYKGTFTSNLSGFSFKRNVHGDLIINPGSGLPIRTDDFVEVGDRQPDFKFGLINNFTWKNFNLSCNLDFRKGGDVFNGNEYILYFTGLSTRTLDREKTIVIKGVLADGLENTSKPTTNTIAVTPYYRTDYFGTGAVTEADFIESVDWVRLRDITLSYNFSSAVLGRQRFFRSASIFVTGTDLFLITNYTGADPSVNANTAFARGYGGAGIDYGAIATPRAISFGVRAQF